MPLIVLLHGYGLSGPGHDSYFGLSAITKKRGVVLAIPNGTRDHSGKLFWNATDACCDFDADKKDIDDVAYLDALIDDVAHRAAVDAARVYIIGHSNGGFMAHRYACDRSDRVAAIVSLAGVPFADAVKCAGRNVSVLQIHGDTDSIIAFEGGKSFGNGAPYPSAEFAVSTWAKRDGCGAARHAEGTIDLDLGIGGAETTRESYDCPAGLDVSLWRMHGSGHVPRVGAGFINAALDFLLKHHR